MDFENVIKDVEPRKLFYLSSIINSTILWIFSISSHITCVLCNFAVSNFKCTKIRSLVLRHRTKTSRFLHICVRQNDACVCHNSTLTWPNDLSPLSVRSSFFLLFQSLQSVLESRRWDQVLWLHSSRKYRPIWCHSLVRILLANCSLSTVTEQGIWICND